MVFVYDRNCDILLCISDHHRGSDKFAAWEGSLLASGCFRALNACPVSIQSAFIALVCDSDGLFFVQDFLRSSGYDNTSKWLFIHSMVNALTSF
jgi:hypothetical protein